MEINNATDEMYLEIGKQLVGEHDAALPLTHSQYIERGKKWFEKKISTFQETICNNEPIKKVFTENSEEKALIMAIADLIASATMGVSPITVATLVVKIGADKFCSTYWKNK
jgi:hypothetical protein